LKNFDSSSFRLLRGCDPAGLLLVAHGQVVQQLVDLVVLVQRMARRVEAAILHQQRHVQVAFLGRRVRHQLDLQLQEEHLTRSHVAARCRELAAQVALQVVALADGIEDHVAAPGSRGSDAALCSIGDPKTRTAVSRRMTRLTARRAVLRKPSDRCA
jgi:hypothetical protein